MKIGFFDPYLDTLTGGERYILTAAACLAKNNHVSIFWDDKSVIEKAREKFDLDLESVYIIDSIFSSNVSFFKRLFISKEFDIIFYLSDGSIPFLLSRKTILHFQFPILRVKGRSMSSWIKLKKIHASICNSFFTKGYIDKTYGIDSTVIYPPVKLYEKISSLIKKENIILSVGRFSIDQKGTLFKKQDFLISTFKEIVDKGLKDWKFVLVVSYLEKDKEKFEHFKRTTDGYPIQILSTVSNEKMLSLYKQAKIYWHAAGYQEDLENHPERAEHFGIATAEAMGYYMVPVVINAGGQKEIVSESNTGFLWKTKEELTKKTLLLVTNESKRKQIAEAAHKYTGKFGIERFCREVTNIIS